jgi:signal-transduction protein with cAMP-binding, CBS, and nucleotidyltransferase domain
MIIDTDVAAAVADGADPEDVRISDLPRSDPLTVPPETIVPEAAALLVSSRIRHLPVVANGRLAGMLDITDACRGLVDAQEGSRPQPRFRTTWPRHPTHRLIL